MGGRTRRTIGVTTAAGLAIAGVIGVTSMSVSGETPTETEDPYLEPSGTLTVTLADRAGVVTLFDTTGSVVASQAIATEQPCSKIAFGPVQTASGATPSGNLLNFTGFAGGVTNDEITVQVPDDVAGVSSSSTSCGAPDGLVGPGEELVLELGSALGTSALIASGSLEIAKTNPQDRNLTLSFIGGDYPATGGATTEIPVPNGGDTVLLDDQDLFTGVAIGSTASKDNRGLSLAGPGDPTTSTTRFNLVAESTDFDFAVDCGEFVQVTGTYATSAEFLRAQNGIDLNGDGDIDLGEDKGEPCVDVGVTVDIEEDRVFWNNSVIGVDGSEQDVTGIVTIDFEALPGSTGFDPAALDREIDFDAGGSTFGFIPVSELWCLDYERTDAAGGPVLDVTFPQIDDPDDPGTATIAAPWCLVKDTRHLSGDTIFQTLQLVGNGDPWVR